MNNINNIRIINDEKKMRQDEKSALYINIFGEEPRNEGYQCNDCKKLFGLSETKNQNLQQCICGGDLTKMYESDQVDTERQKRSEEAGYIGALAENMDNKLIGFIMGRETSFEKLNTEKLGLAPDQMDMITKEIKSNFQDFDVGNFFYGAELGVESNMRGQGIASKLYKEREDRLKNRGTKYIVIRTTRKKDKPYRRYQKEGFEDVFLYNDQQDRVIMIKKLT